MAESPTGDEPTGDAGPERTAIARFYQGLAEFFLRFSRAFLVLGVLLVLLVVALVPCDGGKDRILLQEPPVLEPQPAPSS